MGTVACCVCDSHDTDVTDIEIIRTTSVVNQPLLDKENQNPNQRNNRNRNKSDNSGDEGMTVFTQETHHTQQITKKISNNREFVVEIDILIQQMLSKKYQTQRQQFEQSMVKQFDSISDVICEQTNTTNSSKFHGHWRILTQNAAASASSSATAITTATNTNTNKLDQQMPLVTAAAMKPHFNVISWRIPAIDMIYDNILCKQDLFTKLHKYKLITDELKSKFEHGVWDILNEHCFVNTFSRKLFSKIKRIPFDDGKYFPEKRIITASRTSISQQMSFLSVNREHLNRSVSLPAKTITQNKNKNYNKNIQNNNNYNKADSKNSNSAVDEKYEHLMSEIENVTGKYLAKSSDLVLIGQASTLSTVLLLIRQCEISYQLNLNRRISSSFAPKFHTGQTIMDMISRSRTEFVDTLSLPLLQISQLERYETVIGNIVIDVGIDSALVNELIVKQAQCHTILDIQLSDVNPLIVVDDDIICPDLADENSEVEEEEEEKDEDEEAKEQFQFATIIFDNCITAETVVEKINSDEGIYICGHRIEIVSQEEYYLIEPRRKTRTIHHTQQLLY